jgi:P4 family phage/plasmid primase-like protien
MSQYNKVIICETKCKTKKFEITDMSTYKTELNKLKIPTELVGAANQFVKPYFDIDTELPKDTVFDEQSVLTMATEKIKKMFKLSNTKDIYILKRDKREKNGKYKYSYHITVDNISIANFNIKKLLDDAKITDFDTGVYDKNRALHPIYTSRKVDKEDGFIDVPEFKPYDVFKGYLENVDITKYCPSYITETFDNWDVHFEKIDKKRVCKNDEKLLEFLKYTDTETIKMAKSLINDCLSHSRANDYTQWIELGWVCRNIDNNLLDVWDEFSKKGDTYKEGECEKLWASFKETNKKIGTLRYWAKNDNISEYNKFVSNNVGSYIDMSLGSDGSHFDIAKVISIVFKDKIVYDSKAKCWYTINNNNVWEEDKEFLSFNIICSVNICELYLKRSNYYDAACDDCIQKALNEEKSKKCMKIATKLKDSNFIKSLNFPIKSLMAVPDFVESKLDSDTDIFAFNDCLYDLKTCAIRPITPEDYVFTTTGYNYNSKPDEDIITNIYKFLRDIQKDEENYKYNLDVMTSCLIGRNIFQEIYFKTGSGANGKSTEQNLYAHAFGKYAGQPNAEVLTKPSKGANETSELHNTKGKRVLFLQEPDSSDKLVISRIKKLTGGDKLCVRGLFCNPVEFYPQFKIILGSNDMLQFSKIDGGIQRRTRVITYDFRFVEEPQNEGQKLKDCTLEDKFKDDVRYRDACIYILLSNWVNIKGLTSLKPPQSVIEESLEYCNSNNQVMAFINEGFELTNDANDEIMYTVLFGMFETASRDTKITKTEFSNRLRDMGIKKIRRGKLQVLWYVGIKRIEEDED